MTEEKKFWGSGYVVAFLFLIIIFLRFIHLDADPSFTKRVSDISDEAIWGIDARSLALFDRWPLGEVHFGLDSAPLYTYLMEHIFKWLGANLFTLRLLSAISGSITALLLFFFVNKIAGRKQGVLALALYGFGNAPFVYNRIGHIESTLTLFLFLMFIFWYVAKEKQYFYFLSGLMYGLAFLIKFTALFFFPALVGYWIYEHMHGRWQWKKFLYFTSGAALPIVVYILFFLIPYWDTLAKSMLAHGENNFFGAEVLQNSLKVLGNNIFGMPTVFILFLLLIFYLLYKLSTLQQFKLKEIIMNLHPIEAICLSWIFMGTLGILLSDVSDRRLTIMFVPVIILVSYFIFELKSFSLKELCHKVSSVEFRPTFWSRQVYFFALLLPVFSLPYIQIRLLGESTALFRYGSVLLMLGYILTAFLFSYGDKKLSHPEKRVHYHSLLLSLSLIIALFDPFTVLLRHFIRHGVIVFSMMPFEKLLVIATTTIFFVLFMFMAFFLYRKSEFLFRKKQGIVLISLYFLVSAALILEVVFFPKYTTVEATQQLLQITEPKELIFGEAMEIVYDTDLEFIFYLPYNDKFGDLNKNLFSMQPRYFVYSKVFDGQEDFPLYHKRLFEDLQQRYSLELLGEMSMYRYPLTEKYKIKLQVYEMRYDS